MVATVLVKGHRHFFEWIACWQFGCVNDRRRMFFVWPFVDVRLAVWLFVKLKVLLGVSIGPRDAEFKIFASGPRENTTTFT